MDKSEGLKSIIIRADSPEVAERLHGSRDMYYQIFSESVDTLARVGSHVEGVAISPQAICALDMVEEHMILERYGVPVSGRDLVPIWIWGEGADVAPILAFRSSEEAKRALSILIQRKQPDRVEGVNLFLLPDVTIDRSEGFGKEIISESSERWALYTLRPSPKETL